MRHGVLLLLLTALAACATQEKKDDGDAGKSVEATTPPYPSTYAPPAAPPVLIRDATVLTGTGERIDQGDVLIADGRISAVGRDLQAPAGATIVEGRGKWVTPGLIDVHSHLGVYPSPSIRAHSDGNEATDPITANVWAEHSVWPQDPGFTTALAGGITSLQVLPGSANLMGGRGVTLKNVPSVTYQGMKFPGAPHGFKMACGENPKRVYGGRRQFPSTRMGNVAGWRAEWIEARKYIEDHEEYREKLAKGDEDAKAPERDLKLDTLAGVLKGEILVHNHCYRADEMATVLDMAKEFGYHVSAFHHAAEAYKIADLLAENGTCGAMWADWWGFKAESYDGIPENIAIVDYARNGCAIVHSDSDEGIQRLNQEAAKAVTAARRMGVEIPPERAIRWITSNAARALGIDKMTGSLEPGKMADVVVWSGDPFSVYALTDYVFIDGVARLDRAHPPQRPNSDFLLGQPAAAGVWP